jgi:hypothetical protein
MTRYDLDVLISYFTRNEREATPMTLRHALILQGWPQPLVDEAFAHCYGAPPSEPPGPPRARALGGATGDEPERGSRGLLRFAFR